MDIIESFHSEFPNRVKAMDNYLLLVRFDNGEEKIYNCLKLLNDDLFSSLKNKSYFSTVHTDDMGIVCWNDATDINPYELYENSQSVKLLAFA